MNVPRPATVKQMRSFMRLAGHVSKFIIGYSDLAAPFFKGAMAWTREANTAFNKMKTAICFSIALSFLPPDVTPALYTVTSIVGITAVLGHDHDNSFIPLLLSLVCYVHMYMVIASTRTTHLTASYIYASLSQGLTIKLYDTGRRLRVPTALFLLSP